MRTFAAIVLHWLHQVSLAVWLGGIVVLGAIGAPAPFRLAKAAGQRDWSQPLYRFAGTAAGEMFGRFNTLVLIAGTLLLIAGLGYGLLTGLCRRRLFVRAGLVAVALGIAVWLSTSMYPAMVALRETGRMGDFDRMHHLYSQAFGAQALMLMTVAALTAWMHLDREAAPAPEPEMTAAGRPVPAS